MLVVGCKYNISLYDVDIDECSNTSLHNCSELQVCVNLDGSYACDCIHGYMEQNSTCVGKTTLSSSVCQTCFM